ncbi:hypothetical protein HPB47_019048 [Ixodes persulcatus]|uniref:Uncharacterized protein n=1 Tax=Ixodes persulcatus TaxID=34615 RepID=A0AC60QJ70_IXOPE|nr:hypothetical protein HPB47_019048 [Ixodes persulcatus]
MVNARGRSTSTCDDLSPPSLCPAESSVRLRHDLQLRRCTDPDVKACHPSLHAGETRRAATPGGGLPKTTDAKILQDCRSTPTLTPQRPETTFLQECRITSSGRKFLFKCANCFDYCSAPSQRTRGFRAEFASIDAKRRHKDESRHRTQHPEENLKEFIYTIADFYEKIKQEVPDFKEVHRVLRQMHPQLQDLAEGTQYANLSELAKAADGLTERAWWRLRAQAAPHKKQPGGPCDTRYSRTGSSSGCVISNSRSAVDVSLATPPCGN